MIKSRAKASLSFILYCSLLVLPFLFFLFFSNCVSVESSVLNKEEVFAEREEGKRHSVSEWETVYRVTVLGNVDWTDTGIEVEEDQEIYFTASKQISLQKGNPMAWCGPDGMDLKTMQQPLSDKNIGALIGKVVWLISIEIDEETDEEIRHEITEMFYIGSVNKARMPISGRLFLGVNENVVGDNSGEYEVVIYLPFTLFPL